MKVRAFDWKNLTTWGIALVLALLCLGWVMRHEAELQLQISADAAGLRWANFAQRTVPDLEVAFSGRGFTPAAREQLLRLRKADGVFRFKLYDPLGDLILVSDDLTRPNADLNYPPSAKLGAQSGGPQATIRDKMLAGITHVELKHEERFDGPAVYSEAYVPVMRDGRLHGVMEVFVDHAAQAQTIRNAFVRVATAVALLLTLVLAVVAYFFWVRLRKQRQAEDRVNYMVQYDLLSGALNRTSFTEALEQAIRQRTTEDGPGFSLLCIDLDRFKEVNDALGHAAGDEVLRVVTRRLNASVREGDTVARLGGDEFAVLLRGVSTASGVSPLAQRLVEALAEPYNIAGQRVTCGASIGAAIHGVDATEQAELLHKADLALYRAKAAGHGTFSFYDTATDALLKARRELTRDLNEALEANQLSLHYQPLHASPSGTLTGYEALLRWNHPTLGNVPPMEFIPLAEETGLIDALGLWVLHKACADAMRWPPTLSVAINLSPAQFARGDLVDLVSGALRESGLPARRLELEITESLLLKNADQVLSQLRALSAMGVSIAMDDFGTGYSSLAYLWRFPFDKVKIDRAFTQNLGHDPKVDLIVRSIITLAHSLNIRVNAEGVETPNQMTTLQAHGCDELQGYLLGYPGPLAGLTHKGHIAQAESGLAVVRFTEQRESMFADLPAEPLPTQFPPGPAALA